jgi:hypothetical protein
MELNSYSSLWKAVIRPPRAEYTLKDLGPNEVMVAEGCRVARSDFTVRNKRGLAIHCSHFEPLECDRKWKDMPCVIYCHGNSSCRMEACDIVPYLL